MQTYAQPVQTQNTGTLVYSVGKLGTNRSLVKYIFLSIITFGIYSLVVNCTISTDINIIAFRHDGRKTLNYAMLHFFLGPISLGIAKLVWYHKLSGRISHELKRRGIIYGFAPSTYWLWGVLGAFIIVGPFIYTHKLLKAMNMLCYNYNYHGQ